MYRVQESTHTIGCRLLRHTLGSGTGHSACTSLGGCTHDIEQFQGKDVRLGGREATSSNQRISAKHQRRTNARPLGADTKG